MNSYDVPQKDLPTLPTESTGAALEHYQVIEAKSGLNLPFRELWRYRELLYFLTWRDVKIRYKQTALGAAWAILQPVMTMIVFSLLFGRLAGMDTRTGGVPYPIYVFAGLLPWTFFSTALANSGNSVVGSANLITKVYFPRLIIPLASAGAGLVDLAISFSVLLVMMVWYKIALTAQLFLVPLFLFGTVLAATGVGTLLSALTVAYRDFRYVVPFLVQIWMFITPVIYPSSIIPKEWRWVQALNPMAGLIDGFRASFLGRPLEWGNILISLAVSIALFFMGVFYFRSVERRFADII
ncbi:ABC transporter permease [Armatimonas rosea]|uniref:Transport permease protein n=1 Tax=Armatimonas rosea TaxID=685828 RepID=A0A7W9SNT6_ARMRO|nr:ABC transporter permease [Armatimonas rosea]MBB6049273.1 lipopolysaccharide transport system permease protein [Armatimonas rosea]